jgi:hypothetical protein
MDDKINDLKVAKIIQEYTFLKTDEELKKELINVNQQEFLELINTRLNEFQESDLKPQEIPTEPTASKKIEPKINIDEIDNNTKVKLKKIYREIVKLTHPDKVDSEELKELYMQAKDAYESFDLFELYFIGKTLKLSFKLTLEETKILNELIDFKKNEIKQLESSFVWIWLNSENEVEKNMVIYKFLKTHYLK